MKALEHAHTARRRMYAVAWIFASPLGKMVIEEQLSRELRCIPDPVLMIMMFATVLCDTLTPLTWDGTTYHGELARRMVHTEQTRRLFDDAFAPGTIVGDATAGLFGDVSDAKGNYDA